MYIYLIFFYVSIFQVVHFKDMPSSSSFHKVIHQSIEYHVPIKVVDNKNWMKSKNQFNNDQVVIATDGRVPFHSFGTEPWKHHLHQRTNSPDDMLTSRYSECVRTRQKLLATHKTSRKLLQENEHYFLIMRKFADFEDSVKSCLEYMDRFDFGVEDDAVIVERRFHQIADQVAKTEKLHQDLLNDLKALPDSHHRSYELSSTKDKACSMMEGLQKKHKLFEMDYQKHHGCRMLASSYSKIETDIVKLRNNLTRDPTYSNLSAIRLAQRDFQEQKRFIESMNITMQKLNIEYEDLTEAIGANCLEPSLVSLVESIKDEMVALQEASQEKGENLASLYGIHGYMADVEELVTGLEEYDVFLNGINVPESLGEIQQNQDYLQQLGDEFSHKMQMVSDLLRHGESIEKSMTNEVKAAHKKLLATFQSTSELEISKSVELSKKKKSVVSENAISKIVKILEDISKGVEDLDFQRDTLGVSHVDLMRECERLNGLLILQRQRFVKVLESRSGDKVESDDDHELSGSFEIVESKIVEVERSLDELKESGAELLTFEKFTVMNKSLLESMKDGVNRISDCHTEVDVKNLKRRNKDLDATRMFIKSLEALKNDLYEKGSGFLEDCHFASAQISDDLENVETMWHELLTTLDKTDNKFASIAKENQFRTQYQALCDAQKRLEKRLSNETKIDSLSSAKKSLNDSKLLEKEIESKMKQGEELLKDCESMDESMLKNAKQLLCDLKDTKKRCLESQRDREIICNYQSFLIQSHLGESWLNEKLDLLTNIATPKNITEAISIFKSLEMSRQQISRHDQVIQNVISSGEFCLNNDPTNSEIIKDKILSLNTLSQKLNKLLNEKCFWIDGQLRFLQYKSDGENHLEYIDTKLATINEREYGNDLNSVENALQQHTKFKEELLSYKEQLKTFVKEANHLSCGGSDVKQLAQSVKNKYKKLEQCSNYRHKMLCDSQQLFTLFSEADNLRISMAEFSKTIPEDKNSGTHDEAVLHNDRLVMAIQRMASIHKVYNNFQQRCQGIKKTQHDASVAKLKGKIDAMYNKISEKLNSRLRKSNKLLGYFEYTSSMSSTAQRLDDLQKLVKIFHRKSHELSTISSLKEELRQSQKTLNESKMVRIEIKDLADKLSKLTEDFPGKSIQGFAQHLKGLKSRYTDCTKMLKDSQSVVQAKISDLSFEDDVAHMDGWLSNVLDEIDVAVDGALDFASSSLSFNQVQMKCKEIELKSKLLDSLGQSITSSKGSDDINQSTTIPSITLNNGSKDISQSTIATSITSNNGSNYLDQSDTTTPESNELNQSPSTAPITSNKESSDLSQPATATLMTLDKDVDDKKVCNVCCSFENNIFETQVQYDEHELSILKRA